MCLNEVVTYAIKIIFIIQEIITESYGRVIEKLIELVSVLFNPFMQRSYCSTDITLVFTELTDENIYNVITRTSSRCWFNLCPVDYMFTGCRNHGAAFAITVATRLGLSEPAVLSMLAGIDQFPA